MSGVGLASVIIVGGLAGWIASLLAGRRHELAPNLAIGVFGSFVGAIVGNWMSIDILPGLGSSLLISTAGAAILLGLLGLFRRSA